jgi:hypothetical protein
LIHSDVLNGPVSLTEYGVGGSGNEWTTAPSVVVGKVCGKALGKPPADTQAGHDLLNSVVQCFIEAGVMSRASLDSVIMNIFYSPLTVGGADLGNSQGHCPPPGTRGNTAYHDAGGRPLIATAYIPLDPHCNGSLVAVLQSMTHEDIEAATDSKIPYWDAGYYARLGGSFVNQEIGDLCEPGHGPEDGRTRFSDFLQKIFGRQILSNHWSANLSKCISGGNGAVLHQDPDFVARYAPWACGRGKNMGISFSWDTGPPWDLGGQVPADGIGVQGQRTLYISAEVTPPGATKPNLTVGNNLRQPTPDTTGFRAIHYYPPPPQPPPPDSPPPKTPSSQPRPQPVQTRGHINIYGFDGDVAIAPGATIALTLGEPWDGSETIASFVAPVAGQINNLNTAPPLSSPKLGWSIFGDTSQIWGKVLGANKFNFPNSPPGGSPCPIEGDQVSGTVGFPSTDPSIVQTPFTTSPSDSEGVFSTPIVTATAGRQVALITAPVAASIAFEVHPKATSLTPPDSRNNVNQLVTLTGAGFARPLPGGAARTSVTVGGLAVTSVVIDGEHVQFTAPPFHQSGTFDVIVSVDGVQAEPLHYTFDPPSPPSTCNGVKKPPATSCTSPESWRCCSNWVCLPASGQCTIPQ